MDRATYNLRKGLCENGHSNCLREWSGELQCSIRKKELLGERQQPHLTQEEERKRVRLESLGASVTFTGSLEKPDFIYGFVTLTCGHGAWYERSTLNVRTWELPLLCTNCDDWKLIHSISPKYRGWPALVLFEMNRKATHVWKHVKNAGSGPA